MGTWSKGSRDGAAKSRLKILAYARPGIEPRLVVHIEAAIPSDLLATDVLAAALAFAGKRKAGDFVEEVLREGASVYVLLLPTYGVYQAFVVVDHARAVCRSPGFTRIARVAHTGFATSGGVVRAGPVVARKRVNAADLFHMVR